MRDLTQDVPLFTTRIDSFECFLYSSFSFLEQDLTTYLRLHKIPSTHLLHNKRLRKVEIINRLRFWWAFSNNNRLESIFYDQGLDLTLVRNEFKRKMWTKRLSSKGYMRGRASTPFHTVTGKGLRVWHV